MKILAVAGSSGGHIFPAISFLETLKDHYKDLDSLLLLPKISIEKYSQDLQANVEFLSVTNIKNIPSVVLFSKAFFESMSILVRYNPNIVVSFGSVVSVPVALCAHVLGKKILLHEQNVIPGRANKFLSGFADRIAISFEKTREYFKKRKEKIVFTGNPLRKSLCLIDKREALDFFGFSPDKFTILVMGGSQSSHNINRGFLRAVLPMPVKEKLQVIHLSGSSDFEELDRLYKELNIKYKIYPFFSSMQNAYSAADLVIARAGATTIAELISYRIPAVLIPYPYAYKHQTANAKVLEAAGAAIIVRDEELNNLTLRDIIGGCLRNPETLKNMRAGYEAFPRYNANELLIKITMEYCNVKTSS